MSFIEKIKGFFKIPATVKSGIKRGTELAVCMVAFSLIMAGFNWVGNKLAERRVYKQMEEFMARMEEADASTEDAVEPEAVEETKSAKKKTTKKAKK